MDFDPSSSNMSSFNFAPSAAAPMSMDQHTNMDNYTNMPMVTNESLSANHPVVSNGQGGFQCGVCFKVKSTRGDLT